LTEDPSDNTDGEPRDTPPSSATEQQFQDVRRFAKTFQNEIGAHQQAGRVQSLDTFDLLRRDHLAQRYALRGEFANNLKLLLVGQIIVADIIFIIYAWVGVKWRIPPTVISAWLGALVVQVIGVVAIVVKGIFPTEGADFSSPHTPQNPS
jgi:hypothetical protein